MVKLLICHSCRGLATTGRRGGLSGSARRIRYLLVLSAVYSLVGCSKSTPTKPALYDPEDVAKKVLEAYDLNGDAKLDAAEQQACLSLVAARERMDMNKDGNLTAGEISQRVEAYRSMSDFIATTIQVLRDSRPVPGICVTMTAETFLWKKSEVYTGVTDESGNVMVASPSGEMVGILPTGLYKVEFGDGDSVIRGCEIADDVPAANWLEFSF